MAVRTKLLSGRNINTDSDFSKYIETVSEPGVIEGLVLANSKIGVGKAWCPCERTNGETIYALVENFTEVSVTGPGHVIISIAQNYIDDGSLINEDGTNVATIEVVETLPSKNYLELWEMSEQGLITDKRNMIKKVGELTTLIESLTTRVNNIDERVEHLEEAGAIDHLEEQGLVGELYTMDDTMFKQITPKLSECTVEDCKVGNTANNTEIHIQRIASGTASNKLKLKVKAVGSPTTTLKVEVRSGVQVTVTEDTEAYWYGDDEAILATGSIAYSSITTDWQELEVTLDSAVGGTKGDLLNIVCYQESSGSVVVNADNYYILACDSTQWSEAFSFVSVNGSTRTRSKLMPYCISDGFAQLLLCKVYNKEIKVETEQNYSGGYDGSRTEHTVTINCPTSFLPTSYRIKATVNIISGTYSSGGHSPAATIGFMNIGTTISGYGTGEIFLAWDTNSSVGVYTGDTGSTAPTIYSYVNADGNYYSSATIKAQFTTEVYFDCGKDGLNVVPKEVKALGETVTCILFGLDGEVFVSQGLEELNEKGLKMIKSEAYSEATTAQSIAGKITVIVGGKLITLPYISLI